MSDAICLISGLGVEVDGATIELRIHHTDSGAHAMMHATYISRRRDRRRRQRQPERDIAHVVAASHFCSGVGGVTRLHRHRHRINSGTGNRAIRTCGVQRRRNGGAG